MERRYGSDPGDLRRRREIVARKRIAAGEAVVAPADDDEIGVELAHRGERRIEKTALEAELHQHQQHGKPDPGARPHQAPLVGEEVAPSQRHGPGAGETREPPRCGQNAAPSEDLGGIGPPQAAERQERRRRRHHQGDREHGAKLRRGQGERQQCLAADQRIDAERRAEGGNKCDGRDQERFDKDDRR